MFVLQIGGVFIAFGSMIWLVVRGARDSAFPDPILFLTGISLIAYIVGRWDRAKAPLILCLTGVIVSVLGNILP